MKRLLPLLASALFACAKPAPPAFVREHGQQVPQGAIAVVAFVDFECSFCRVAHARLHAAAERTGSTLAIAYKHVPLRSHPHAEEAARAHVCAEAQGRGDEAAAALFASDPSAHDRPHLRQLATRLQLDETAFDACLDSESTKIRLASDRRSFIEEQYDGVPVMFVGTLKLDGTKPLEAYATALRQARNH